MTDGHRKTDGTAPGVEANENGQAGETSSAAAGHRGGGGGLADELGRGRLASAAEMLGGADPHGDVAIQVPRDGSGTQGAATGNELSRGPLGTQPPGALDAGGAGDISGGAPADAGDAPAADGDGRALGETPTGGSVKEFDAAFRRRDAEPSGE